MALPRPYEKPEQAGLINGGDLVARGLIATGRTADALKLSGAFAELFPTERARLRYTRSRSQATRLVQPGSTYE